MMKMCSVIGCVAVSMLAVAVSSSASAEGLRAKAGLGMAQYKSPSSGGADFKLNYQALTVGASYLHADTGVFVDLTNRSALGNSKWNAQEFFATSSTPNIPDATASRTENILTVGKMLADGLQVSAGYQVSDVSANVDRSAYRLPSYSLSTNMSGFFAGVGKSMSVGDGILSFSGALALISAKTSSTAPNSASQSYGSGPGYSAGVAYSYPVTDSLSLVGEGKLQSFNPKNYGSDSLTTFGLSAIAKF